MSKTKNENIIKGQTKSGIKFTIDKRITEDSRVMFYIRNLRKYKETKIKPEEAEDALDAMYSLLELIFGNKDQLMIFMNEVAARHNGVADASSMMQELNELFEACNLKN